MSEYNRDYKTGKYFGIFNETDLAEEHYVHICNKEINIVTFLWSDYRRGLYWQLDY
jgi:hypothetical protein